VPARRARESSLGDSVRGARVVFFFTSLYIFVGSTAPPPRLKSSSAAPCSHSLPSQISRSSSSQVLPIVSI